MRRLFVVVFVLLVNVFLLFLGVTSYTHAQITNSSQCIGALPTPSPTTPGPAPTGPGTLFINEILSNPHSQWNCTNQSSSTWIELYNSSNQPIDLYASHTLINGVPSNSNYIVPFGTVILAHSFLVIFVDSNIFPASPPNTELQLFVGGNLIDTVTFPVLPQDQSYARIPDGSNNWQIAPTPTIDASNVPPVATATPTTGPKITSTVGSTRQISTGGQNAGQTSNKQPVSTPDAGLQPSWTQLRLPSATASNMGEQPAQITPVAAPAATSPVTHTLTLPQKIIITTISILVIALVLFWCRKRLITP